MNRIKVDWLDSIELWTIAFVLCSLIAAGIILYTGRDDVRIASYDAMPAAMHSDGQSATDIFER
jgi:hypothetical protein